MVSSATPGRGKDHAGRAVGNATCPLGKADLAGGLRLAEAVDPSDLRHAARPGGQRLSADRNATWARSCIPRTPRTLSVITAGDSLLESLGPLANGVTTAFFEKARAAFTFVVVDGSPILPVIDGLLVSQHADTVVLSVCRDTSQGPQVLRACEKLSAFGSRKHVVVLNGSQEEVCGDYQDQRASMRRVESGRQTG